jgi:formylglycine-generating enzyme required for sulfatase activity
MEYVRGETLRAWMKTRRPAAHEIIAILQQLLEGLQALHLCGLVHRDLKPENIMVTPDGNLRILDLGVARRVAIPDPASGTEDETSLSLGFGVGTPGYMAPEQWRQNDIDGRADVFAIGVIAYELVTGHAPFRGSTTPEIRERTLQGDIALNPECWARVPDELKDAVQVALARDREQRFADVESMVAALLPLFPPTLPPISAPRMLEDRVSATATIAASRGSLAASVVGISARALTQRRPRWLAIVGLTAVIVGTVAALANREPVLLPATPGMVQLPGASYSLGLSSPELDAQCKTYAGGCPPHSSNEVPRRPTTVAPFELDIREVTNEEFALFLNQIGSNTTVADDPDDHYPRFVRYLPRPSEDYLLYDLYPKLAGIQRSEARSFTAQPGFERLPVTLVTLLGAHLYCKGIGKRLPTEGEWELAARGIEERSFPWGKDIPRCGGVHIPSNKNLELKDPEQCENRRAIPFPVMSAPQDVTPHGIHDMGGNVYEWVDDDALLHTKTVTDATRANVEKSGITRGGAFNSSFTARTTGRAFWLVNTPADNVGFRCAKSSSKQ